MILSPRQDKILKTIIEDYIKTASPVGSKKIQIDLGIDVSSATIRNECADLEEKGYLEKQHTSSGRIPSTKGYRYYVDNLMEKNEFIDAKKQIEKIFNQRNSDINLVLEQTSKIISEMTNLASVVSFENKDSNISLTKVELVPVDLQRATVICVLSDGTAQSKIYMLDFISLEDLKISIDLFNERLVNSKLSEIETKIEAIKPILEKQVKRYDFILQTFINTLLNFDSTEVRTTGVQYLLSNPEFEDPEKIKQVVKMIEDSTPFKWFEYQQNQINSRKRFSIGSEFGSDGDDISFIGLDVSEQSGKKGTLTLVGPKRIAYDKISDLIDFIDKKITEQFGDKSGGS